MIDIRLHAEWKLILRKAWSIRFMLVAALLTGAEAVLPFFSLSIPRAIYIPSLFVLTICALVSRVIAQKDAGGLG